LEDFHKETITIINKTYPETGKTVMQKYGYIVCMGGINQDGEWRRLYPIPHEIYWNPKYEKQRVKKWDIIEVKLKKAPQNKDPRKESHTIDWRSINIVGHIGTENNWADRKRILEKYRASGMNELNDAKYKDWSSMGIIKPKHIKSFEERERHQISDQGYLQVMDVQLTLFPNEMARPTPTKINKWIGYVYECEDDDCRGHQMMVTDWECQEQYRRLGFKKTHQKFFDWMMNRDVYFGIGTVQKFWTFIIVSVAYPPKMS